RPALLRVRHVVLPRDHRMGAARRPARRNRALERLARRSAPGHGAGARRFMKYALVNPQWTFDGSIYFGRREPHLPLEYGYAKALLNRAGHDAQIFDGQLGGLSQEEIVSTVADYGPDIAVVTTAPSYLFWRCAPP